MSRPFCTLAPDAQAGYPVGRDRGGAAGRRPGERLAGVGRGVARAYLASALRPTWSSTTSGGARRRGRAARRAGSYAPHVVGAGCTPPRYVASKRPGSRSAGFDAEPAVPLELAELGPRRYPSCGCRVGAGRDGRDAHLRGRRRI